MDVLYAAKAPSGSAIFQSGGFGELQIGELGDQDEYVEIDSDDGDAAPRIELGLRNDASVAGASGGAAGVRTGAKSVAGSSLAPREVGAVSSVSSHGRSEQHAVRSQGSVGRSSRSVVVGRSLPEPTAGADVSPKGSDLSVPKVFNGETSKPSIGKELETRLSVKSNGIRRQSSVDLSKSLSKPVDRGDGDEVWSRGRDAQTIAKRKALDIEPSTSTTPAKRTKVHGNPSDSNDMPRENKKAEEPQPRGVPLSIDSPSMKKENLAGREEEDREKTLRARGMSREKRHRRLVLGDDPDDDTQDEPQWTTNQKSDGMCKKPSRVKAASAEVYPKKDSYTSGLPAKTGLAGSGRHVSENQRLPLAGENGVAPFRSAFPSNAKKKVHPPVSGGNKSHTGARYATNHCEDENSPFTWIGCTKCRKIRKVNADVNLKRSIWCCEMNTRDPKFASCSAPEEQYGRSKADELKMLPETEARTEVQVTLNQTQSKDNDIDIARRNMVWVKLQGDGKEFYWPGLQVTEFPPAIQKKIDEFTGEVKNQRKVVHLFHPREDLENFQIVKRSSVKPFHQTRLSYKDSSSHPDFIAAVTAADEFYAQPDTSMGGFSQLATDSSERPMPKATDEDTGCRVEDMPREEAESNELEFEDAETPGDDPQGSQPQTDNEIETLDDGEVNQVPVEEGIDDVEAREGTKGSEASGEPHGSDGNYLLDLEILPTRRLISFDSTNSMLHFQDGSAVSFDEDSLGMEFNKSSTGPTLRECIRAVGKKTIRKKFPKEAKSSDGLKFSALDPSDSFATRLRDTWVREYQDKPMPELLSTKFVAGCILEERGEPVNWAYDLTRTIGLELRGISQGSRESLGPVVLKAIVQLLERQVEHAPLPTFKAVKEVDPMDITRQEPQEVAESTTLVGENDLLKRPASVYSRANLEVGMVTTEAAGELLGCKEDDKFCVSSADTFARINTDSGGITLLATNVTKDAAYQLPNPNAHESEHTALKDTNVAGDLCVSGMVADAIVGEESQIMSSPRLVDSIHTKRHVLSEERRKMQVVPGNSSVSIDFSAVRASPLDLRCDGLDELGGESSNVQAMGSSPSCIPLTDNGAIQLVNRDERSGNRVGALLCGFTGRGLPEQQGNDLESELEEGEISLSEQANASIKAADTSVSKLADISAPLTTQDIFSVVELPREEEFPSSDDHNSICEGCEVGGELMYVTTASLTSTPSPLMLCDGKGCKVVYHKECLNPPLQTIPAGEWYCPGCEKGKVEKIWSVRKARSVVRSRTDTRSSDATGSGDFQGDQYNSEDEAHDDIPIGARFGSSSQRPDGEVVVNEPGKASGSCANIVDTNLKDDNLEYLVQWKSRSHAHDKWVSEEELEKLAPKELARFKKLLHEGQEKYDSEWAEPERVIQKRLARVTRRQPDSALDKEKISSIQNAELEWFVKWKGLGYEYSTWEPADAGVLATSRGIELINEYESWANAAKQRASKESREEAEKRVTLPIKDLDAQPEWMIRPELLPLQLEALNKLRRLWHSKMNGILVYEASQEKIVMTITFFLSLVEEYRVGRPILVVVPKSLLQNWEHELYQWAPKLYIVNYASKTEDARGIIRRTEFSSFSEPFKPQIVLTTFEVINCDMDHLKKVEWEALIIDEGRRQRLQKSYQRSYRPLSQFKSTFRLLLLSEPLKSNVEELIQFVNFLEPRKSVFSHGDDMTQVTELQRRLAGRVLEYIPEDRLTEYWVPVEMTPVQLEQYYYLLVRHYPTLSRNHRDHQIQEVVAKLRQSCNHPLLADPALNATRTDLTCKEILDHHIEISGKMRLLHLVMPILKAANWRVLIFSQETKQLDILERYMTQSHGSDSYERVDSDVATKTKEAAIQRFNAEGSKRFVLLLKTGVHIFLKNVQFLLLYDSDWNPANDMRALHRIHNEGEAGSKPLPVLRLYTHLTVEESTLILFRDKQLPPTRANVNARICQKLLTWGASKIFDRYDDSNGLTGSSHRPKGARVCPKATLKQVVYNSEVVQKLLDTLVCQEEGSKLEGDELLEAILLPRDEPAPLFAESDHPLNMISGDSADAFWASSLKWRHDVWQAKEMNMLGKGQRGKKRITYDEDAMASAVYSKAQFSEESERKRPRRRKASSEEEQEVVTDPSAQVSFQQWLPSLSNNSPTDCITVQALGPAHVPVNHDHASNRNAGPEKVRDLPESSTEVFWEWLPTICTILELPGPVIERVDALLKYFISTKNARAFYRKARATFEFIAMELALVWLAAKQLNHPIDKMMCFSKVEERIGTKFDNRQAVGLLYDRVVELCADFEPPPAPSAVVSTTSQPLLVPEISSSGRSAQNHPPGGDLRASSRNVPVQAGQGEQPASNLPENPLAGSQVTGQQVEEEVPSPVVLSSAPLSVQVTMSTDDSPAVEESHKAHMVDEPVVEADTEVVLVGADPRLVPEEPLHTFIDQSRSIVPDSDGMLVSGDSMVEQGLGWVLVNPTPDVLVEEQVPLLDVATAARNSSSTARSVGNFPFHEELLQRGREAVSATLGAALAEVPGIPASELPVESTPSLTQTQVSPTQNTGPARPNERDPAMQNEQAATDTAARLKERLYQDRNFIIRGQMKESAVSKSQADQKLEELKRKHDVSRRQPTLDPSVITGREALHNSQKKTLERLNQADFNALDARQRADRDKLRDLYSNLTLSANGEGASIDVRKIELEIQRIKEYYSKFMPPTRPSPSTTEAAPTSTVQADGGSRVAQSLAATNPVADQQRQHAGRSSSPVIPAAMSSQQQRGHSVQSGPQQRGHSVPSGPQQRDHSVQSVPGEGLSNSQRPATEVVATAAMQHTGVQPRGILQRSNASVQPGPAPNLQRGAAVVSRSLSTPAPVPAVPLGVGHMARPSAPASVTPPAGNANGNVYPDVLLKEKEKLNKDLEKAKVAYELESQRIKAEYDKEAEILHKRYETLLVEQHRSYTQKQQQVQQNVMKVEWNRQLAEALKLREELAARAGLSSHTAVQPFANQQAPQQIPGRSQSGGTAAAPVSVNISRVTTNAGNAGPGIAGVTMHYPGTSSPRVSTAPIQHSPRYGMPTAPRNEQPRSSVSGAMAVLTVNIGIPGHNVSAGISRAHLESLSTPSPGSINLDAGSGSPRPRTSGLSLPGVVAPMPPPPFQDPILSIIRNSMPSLDSVVIPQENPVVVPPVSPRETTSIGIPAVSVGMDSSSNLRSSEPANPLPPVTESQIPRNSEPIPDHQIDSGAHSDVLHINIEGVAIQLGSGTQEQPVENVAVSSRPRPPSLVYLSDSDDE